MQAETVPASHESFTTFGAFLRYLRRRARLTQRDVAIAVGYSEAQISRLEQNQRLPDLTTLAALFVPALDLGDAPELAARLLELAAAARGETLAGQSISASGSTWRVMRTERELLEDVPPLPVSLVARDEALARLDRQLAEARLVALCGISGAGKTTLAAMLARQRAPQQPVFWMTLTAGINTSREVLVHQLALFLLLQGHEHLGLLLEPASSPRMLPFDEQVALLAGALSQRPALLCLDNLHVIPPTAPTIQLLAHLAAVTPAAFLLISREVVSLPGISTLLLGGLAPSEGRALAAQLVVGLSPALIERLLDKTLGNPMLIRLAAGQLRDGDAATFLARMEQQPEVTDYLVKGMLRRLSPAARAVLDFLAVFRHAVDLSDELLQELSRAAAGGDELGPALGEIQSHYLLFDLAHARLHPLLHAYLYAQLAADGPRRRGLHRLAAEWALRGARDVLEAVYHYGRAGKLAQAVDLLAGQVDLLVNRGQALVAAEVASDLLVQVRRRRGDQRALLGRLLPARGNLLSQTIRSGEAELDYREALALTSRPALRASLAYRLARSLAQRGEALEALDWCRSGAEALASTDIVLRAQLGAVEGAAQLRLAHYEEVERIGAATLLLAMRVAQVLPALADEVRAQVHNTLAIAAHLGGRVAPALEQWQLAVAAARRADLPHLEHRARFNMGNVLFEQGDLAAALRHYQAARDGLRAIGDSYVTARVLHSIGLIAFLRGELASALDLHEQAALIKRQMGDVQGLATSLNQQARTLLALGRLATARPLIEQVLLATADAGDDRARGYYLLTLAETHLLEGHNLEAQAALAQTLELSTTRVGGPFWCDAHNHLAVAQLCAGELERAAQALAFVCPLESALEVELEQQLLLAVLAQHHRDLDQARARAAAVSERAAQAGYWRHRDRATALLAALRQAPPCLVSASELLWGGATALA